MEPALFWEYIIKSIILLLGLTGGFAYVTYYERKALARLQSRIGPNRAGPLGLLQPIADAVKLIFKEELIPTSANKLLFILAPVITVIPALIITAVIPWGRPITLFGLLEREIGLYIANINVGVLYITAVASIAVYGIVLAGWSSNNKYAMMGGLRATAQMVSYELALALTFVAPVILAGSMSVVDVVERQVAYGEPWGPVLGFILGLLRWNLSMPLGFAIFMVASIAEINRGPFDMPEAEQELTAGYHVEYSGMKFALFFMAEYIKMIAVSMIGATLYLGGYNGPFMEQVPELGPLWLFVKVLILLFVLIWVRGTLPRFRYDHLMAFGWKRLFPLALLNVVIVSIVVALGG